MLLFLGGRKGPKQMERNCTKKKDKLLFLSLSPKFSLVSISNFLTAELSEKSEQQRKGEKGSTSKKQQDYSILVGRDEMDPLSGSRLVEVEERKKGTGRKRESMNMWMI